MNSGITAERVYDALKRRVVTGVYRPGERLDASLIGSALSSSVTPVRDALHLLVGEGLVVTKASDGFHLPHIDAPALEDVYRWNADVLVLAVKAWSSSPRELLKPSASDNADRVGEIFKALAARSQNLEHARAIKSLNDRLHAVRIVEKTVLHGFGDELLEIVDLATAEDTLALRTALSRYHKRRARSAAQLVRALYRSL